MNGDIGKVYKVISEIQVEQSRLATLQEERHDQNSARLAKLDNLPCGVHNERMNSFGKALNVMTTVILVVVVLGIILGIWMKSVGG